MTMPPSKAAALWSLLEAHAPALASDVVKRCSELRVIPPLILAATTSIGVVVELGVGAHVLRALNTACSIAQDLGDPWFSMPPDAEGLVVIMPRACARVLLESLGHEALAEEAFRRLPPVGERWLLGVVLAADGSATSHEIAPGPSRPDRSKN